MPVDFESYHPTDLPDENTNGRRILEFLAAHPEMGYRAGELADELEIAPGNVGTTLSRLENRGLVRHKENIGRSIRRHTTPIQRVSLACKLSLTNSMATITIRTQTGMLISRSQRERRGRVMYERGVIVVAADPFGNTPRRPYLIVRICALCADRSIYSEYSIGKTWGENISGYLDYRGSILLADGDAM